MNCTAPDMDKYRQHGQPPNIEEIIRHAPNMDNMDNVDKRPDVWRRGGRPVLFFCRVCSVRPFVGRITRPVLFVQQETKARKPQHSTPRGCSVQTPPDMAAPRIEAIRYENNRPRPTNRERPKRRRERRGCSVHIARPNIDNVDNMDTDGRRVEAIPHEQEKQTAPNMDNVDNMDTDGRRVEKKRPPPRCSFAACAAFALSFDVSQARALFVQQKTKARKQPPAPPRGAASTHPAPNIDNVDNMDTTARRVEATQARGGEYRKSKRPPPTNRERPKPQIKNERPKKQRARLCTNIQHEAKRNNRHALRLYGASRQEPKRYAPAYSPASSS